ncbi:MAG TPA: prolipoprotein diacylglyceryl transferase family protein, partial [Thermodesulfobacteriota bacterium]
MYPVLLAVGGWQLWTYGVLVALAFALGLALAMREARLAGEDPQRVLDLAFFVVLAAVVGAKVGFAVTQGEAAGDPLRALWQGGLSFPGGLLAAGAVAAWYLRRHRLSPARLADLAAPAVLLGLAVADLGCLAAGCEYGRPTSLPVGLVFRDARALAPTGVPLHPTQAYSAAWSLVLLAVVLWARGRHAPRQPGQLALLALGGLALGQ